MPAIGTFIFIWFFIAIIILKFNNSVRLLENRNIPLKFQGGYTVPVWRIKEVIEEYSDDLVLVRRLQRALWCMRIGSFLLFSWILFIIILGVF